MRDAISLNKQEVEQLYRIIDSSLRVRKRHHFFLWTQQELQSLFPHEILICGASNANAKNIPLHKFSTTPYFTDVHFEQLCHPQQGLVARMMEVWRNVVQPCLFDHAMPISDVAPCWRPIFEQSSALKENGLRNIAAHGVSGLGGSLNSFFSFSRIPGKLGERHAYLLELLVPYLHTALVRVLTQDPVSRQHKVALENIRLTTRERQVLGYISKGKSNIEIAESLNISPLTVKSHMQNILPKLNVKTRGQAVSKALRLGVIDSDNSI